MNVRDPIRRVRRASVETWKEPMNATVHWGMNNVVDSVSASKNVRFIIRVYRDNVKIYRVDIAVLVLKDGWLRVWVVTAQKLTNVFLSILVARELAGSKLAHIHVTVYLDISSSTDDVLVSILHSKIHSNCWCATLLARYVG